jgi:hypothetical protein
MQCGNATGGRAFVCMQHALRRTSLTCKISKMILIPHKIDVHPTPALEAPVRRCRLLELRRD